MYAMLTSLRRHSRESGNPVTFGRKTLGLRFRGDDASNKARVAV